MNILVYDGRNGESVALFANRWDAILFVRKLQDDGDTLANELLILDMGTHQFSDEW